MATAPEPLFDPSEVVRRAYVKLSDPAFKAKLGRLIGKSKADKRPPEIMSKDGFLERFPELGD